MFVVHLPGRLIHPITSGHGVRSIIRPSEDTTVPVITDETSTEALANLSTQQQQQIMSLIAAQIAANKDLGGTVVAGDPNHGGYPAKWDAPIRQDSRLDSWGMYNRECVSYAAWKVYQTYGSMPYWGGVGNANQWVRDARRAGIATGPTPAVHSVAISMRGYYGHAMWVEKVAGDMIYVSQYNYDLHGHYSEMWLHASDLTYIYFK
jgi:surface antigen